jgi:hypothetical protein
MGDHHALAYSTAVQADGIGFGAVSWGPSSASVPEPSTILLLGAGLAGVGLLRRRFKN